MSDSNNNPNKPNDQIDAPPWLLGKVMSGIEAERVRLAAKRRFALVGTVLVSAIVALFPVWNAFLMDLTASGFGQYVSLLFSDFGVVSTNWQDYGLSLLESLPAVSLIGLLAVATTLLFTLRLTFVYGKILLSSPRAYRH